MLVFIYSLLVDVMTVVCTIKARQELRAERKKTTT